MTSVGGLKELREGHEYFRIISNKVLKYMEIIFHSFHYMKMIVAHSIEYYFWCIFETYNGCDNTGLIEPWLYLLLYSLILFMCYI
jgi:hypothetical protein